MTERFFIKYFYFIIAILIQYPIKIIDVKNKENYQIKKI
jgi:hypothetical protein